MIGVWIGLSLFIALFIAIVRIMVDLTISENKGLKKKKGKSFEAEARKSALAYEIRALEIDLGMREPEPEDSLLNKGVGGNHGPKWRINKKGTFWVVSYNDKSYAASTSFSGAVEELGTLSSESVRATTQRTLDFPSYTHCQWLKSMSGGGW